MDFSGGRFFHFPPAEKSVCFGGAWRKRLVLEFNLKGRGVMRKKVREGVLVYSVVLIMLLFVSQAQAGGVRLSPLNTEFAGVSALAGGASAGAAQIRTPWGDTLPAGRRSSPLNLEHLKHPVTAAPAWTRTAFPAKFDLRTLNRLSSIRDQAPYGFLLDLRRHGGRGIPSSARRSL